MATLMLRRCLSIRLLTASRRPLNDDGIDALRSRILLKCQSLSWTQFACLRSRYSTKSVTGSSPDMPEVVDEAQTSEVEATG